MAEGLPGAAELELLVTRVMPFGKHKGTLIADLPGNYLNWFAREGFPPGEIGRLLALMQELDHNGLSPVARPATQEPVADRHEITGAPREHAYPVASPQIEGTLVARVMAGLPSGADNRAAIGNGSPGWGNRPSATTDR